MSEKLYGRQKKQRSFEPAYHSYDGETYYGRPALKPSVYNWIIGLYFFMGGLAGSAQIIATIADWFGGRRQERQVRAGRYISLISSLIGSGLLVADLKKPLRFYNMLRIFRPTSVMSIGAYILSAFSVFTGMVAVCQFMYDRTKHGFFRTVAHLAGIPGSVAGIGMSIYTGTLLAATSIPLWTHSPRLLAMLFGSSAMNNATAALKLVSDDEVQTLTAVSLITGTAEIAVNKLLNDSLAAGGVDSPFQEEPFETLHKYGAGWFGLYASTLLNALALLTRSRFLSRLASLATLVGGVILRLLWVYGGNRSAEKPQDYFQWAQPD